MAATVSEEAQKNGRFRSIVAATFRKSFYHVRGFRSVAR
jgi:hypothetical protein